MPIANRSPREKIAYALSVFVFGLLSFIPGLFDRSGDAYAQYSGGGGGATCAAGGRGSSSCSYSWIVLGFSSSCSVTCNAGTYACCNTDSCTCKV